MTAEGALSEDDTEFDSLLKATNPNDPREALIFLLAGDLGLREEEISALRSTWINFQRGHIIIPSKSEQGWTPKRPDSARTIPRLKDVSKGMGNGKNVLHSTSLARYSSYDSLSNCSEGRIEIRVEEEGLSPFAMGNRSYSACL